MKLTEDEKYIKKCIALADKAAKKGDIPVGALVCGIVVYTKRKYL